MTEKVDMARLLEELEPLIHRLNESIPDLTAALERLRENTEGSTQKVKEVEFQSTLVVSYGLSPRPDRRGRLVRFA